MSRHLPTTETLRAFDATIRLGSFSRAADEVHLTHGAVSRRIAALEEDLDVRLFERQARGVRPTAAGLSLHAVVADVLERLRRGLDSLKPDARPVRVSVLPSFASRWLLPRLGAFRASAPEIDVRLTADYALVPVGRGQADLAIRYGIGPWRDTRSELLFEETLFPVAAPGRRLDGPDELTTATLLHDSDRADWQAWLAALGWPEPRRFEIFNDYHMVLEAAASGHGIAMGRSRLVEPDLAAGRLARLRPEAVTNPRAHHLILPPTPLDPAVERLADWLRRTAAAER